MGSGVVLMHYTGIASMAVSAPITWDYRWVSLSVVIAQLASSLAGANKELALQDTLTRQPNRVLFEDRLSQAISKADRETSPFALMFMDLDGFKAVNDAFGHDVKAHGSAVLRCPPTSFSGTK